MINGGSVYDFDVTKLSVYTRDIGLAGIEVYDLLRDEYDIQIELGDIANILAYISIGDRIQDIGWWGHWRISSGFMQKIRKKCREPSTSGRPFWYLRRLLFMQKRKQFRSGRQKA